MDWGMIVVYVALGVVLISLIPALPIILRAGPRRKQDDIKHLATWAQRTGLTLNPNEDHSIGSRFPLFKCLQGHDCFAFNIMDGSVAERPVSAFDCHNLKNPVIDRIQTQDIRSYWLFSGLVVESGLSIKPLFIRPKDLVDRVTELAGFEDVHLESAEFNKKFFVESPDRRWAHDVLQPKTMELVLSHPRFTLDFQGSQVMAYCADNRMFSPGDFAAALELVMGILDNLPDSVMRQAKAASAEAKPS